MASHRKPRPLCIDLYCGLGGWAQGFLDLGFDVVGFDTHRHDYGTGVYPGQLVLQDATTLHGSQFAHAAVIVASPPCQEFSYMSMPWSRGKQIAAAIRGERGVQFPDGYTGSRTRCELTALFDACFRIQQEACEAALAIHGHHIPLIIENVKGAQPWVGRSRGHYGSYYLWGDMAVPPNVASRKNNGGSWFAVANNTTSGHSQNPVNGPTPKVGGITFSGHGTPGYKPVAFNVTALQRYKESIKNGSPVRDEKYSLTCPPPGIKQGGSGPAWFDKGIAARGGNPRMAASAHIAKIPPTLSTYATQWVLRYWGCELPQK